MTCTLFALTAAFALSVPAFADDEKKADDKKSGRKALAGKVDKAKVFETMDADKDGKLSKDEFAAGMEKMTDKLKERAGERASKLTGVMEKLAERVFEKLDADKDGAISKDEYEKSEFDLTNLKALREKLGKGKDK
jgi:Ca2+-binding EF-hand superfamily protein